MNNIAISNQNLHKELTKVIDGIQVIDVHTHLFPPEFQQLCLSGIDELLTYHYLVAEFFRIYTGREITPNYFFSLPKSQQAELIWSLLFVQNTPLSEACQGIITVLKQLGMTEELKLMDLSRIRQWFSKHTNEDPNYLDNVFKLAGVKWVYMTNNIFDPIETEYWFHFYHHGIKYQNLRFKTCLRIDEIFFPNKIVTSVDLMSRNFFYQKPMEDISENDIILCSEKYIGYLSIYFENWYQILQPEYIMMSLAYNFDLEKCSYNHVVMTYLIIPFAIKYRLPIFFKLGTDRQVNPRLQQAGDSLGICDFNWLIKLCQNYPDIKFIVTVLSMENQHQLAVLARKFPNLHLYGCWWFCNNPSMIREITCRRIELLGNGFTFQHSDARILEQLIYKWKHSKNILKDVLLEQYKKLLENSYPLTLHHLQNDVANLTGNTFLQFIEK